MQALKKKMAKNLNTSHVKLQRDIVIMPMISLTDLNTSHVKLQLDRNLCFQSSNLHLNTSHVKLQRKGH